MRYGDTLVTIVVGMEQSRYNLPKKLEEKNHVFCINEDPKEPFKLHGPYSGICWWDLHSYEVSELGHFTCPMKYDDQRDRYFILGHFCSCHCLYAYWRTEVKGSERKTWFKPFLKRVYGIVGNITPAPPRLALKLFSPTHGVKIDKFREFGPLKVLCFQEQVPMFPFIYHIWKRDQQEIKKRKFISE